mmetsp:Transcript_20564/g.30489  ORF Transcript_20564/g.30489 Transcript_20564/m.30489 type:complete len:586 (-) Transcript_20564:294-2051(-)
MKRFDGGLTTVLALLVCSSGFSSVYNPTTTTTTLALAFSGRRRGPKRSTTTSSSLPASPESHRISASSPSRRSVSSSSSSANTKFGGRILCYTTRRNYELIKKELPKKYIVDHAGTRNEAYKRMFNFSKGAAIYQAIICDDKMWDMGSFFELLHKNHMIPLRLLYTQRGMDEDEQRQVFDYHGDAYAETLPRLRGALKLLTDRTKSRSIEFCSPLQRIKFRMRTLLSLSDMRLTSRVQRHLKLIQRLDRQYESTTLLNTTTTTAEARTIDEASKEKEERATKAVVEVDTVNIVHISDTHFLHRWVELPSQGGDILIHTGDICGCHHHREEDEAAQLADFLWWLVSSKALERFKLVVFIAGNHDTVLDPRKHKESSSSSSSSATSTSPDVYKHCMEMIQSYEKVYPNLRYLCNSSVKWNGLHIYGTPTTICREETDNMTFVSNAFELTQKERLACWKMIPQDVDILLTHMPPAGIGGNVDVGDTSFSGDHTRTTHVFTEPLPGDSCDMLTNEVYSRSRSRRPLLHAFGHIHTSHGIGQHESTVLSNGSQERLLNDDNIGGGLPIAIDLPIRRRRKQQQQQEKSGTS